MIRKTIAALVAAIALAMVPAAAMGYTPVAPGGSTITVGPGGTVNVPFTGFAPNEDVVFTLTGESASAATLAGVQSFTKAADADGAASVTVTLPENAAGTYSLTASQDGAATATVTIDSGVAAGAGDELSATGAEDNTALMVGAATLLVAGAGAVVFAAHRRTKVDA